MKMVVIGRRKAVAVILCAVCTAVATVGASQTGVLGVFAQTRSLPIYSVETEEKKVAITFDAAWGTEHTDELLSVLAEHNAKATFFLVQFWTEKYPEYVQKIADGGHAIGTHSATHGHMSKQTEERIAAELNASAGAITQVTGQKVTLFRPPFGDYNDRLIQTAQKLGYLSIQWDVDSLDWKDLSAEQITDRVIKKVRNGSIILCHNNGKNTAKALPVILEKLQGEGYEFVRVDELVYTENYTVDHNGRQQKNNK